MQSPRPFGENRTIRISASYHSIKQGNLYEKTDLEILKEILSKKPPSEMDPFDAADLQIQSLLDIKTQIDSISKAKGKEGGTTA